MCARSFQLAFSVICRNHYDRLRVSSACLVRAVPCDDVVRAYRWYDLFSTSLEVPEAYGVQANLWMSMNFLLTQLTFRGRETNRHLELEELRRQVHSGSAFGACARSSIAARQGVRFQHKRLTAISVAVVWLGRHGIDDPFLKLAIRASASQSSEAGAI